MKFDGHRRLTRARRCVRSIFIVATVVCIMMAYSYMVNKSNIGMSYLYIVYSILDLFNMNYGL